ncbi:hypothetical protein JXA27_06750 [Aerococcaceae bacterium zg-B36]|uniref:PQ-loop domain-containing transporter n=1 Tax=Aerococcaceae bacterium zg-252 TaxID=2796928 RepID=UPI001BD82D7A|nr:hypothetical protein [Aerococcaceae bacterium zg-B36]
MKIKKNSQLLKMFALTIAPAISAIAITVSYLPQLWLTFTSQNVTGQSVVFWLLLVVSLTGLFIQQLGIIKYNKVGEYGGVITQGINLLCAILMLIMVLLFK